MPKLLTTRTSQKLHWLSIIQRIEFKYKLFVDTSINFNQPTYLSNLIKPNPLTHGKRLTIPSTKPKKNVGRHSFTHAVASEWNILPWTIRDHHPLAEFRSNLKTSSIDILWFMLPFLMMTFGMIIDSAFSDISTSGNGDINLVLRNVSVITIIKVQKMKVN